MSPDSAPTDPRGEILIVEDDPSDLSLLSAILTEAGFRTRPAADGELALSSIQARLPDLILLDLKLPGIDGVEVCRRLKAVPATQDLPIIFISALSDTELKVKALGSGAIDYVTKPFEGAEILARIGTHISMHRLRQRLAAQSRELLAEIEERKRAEEARRRSEEHLQQAQKLESLGVLAGGIAHDFANILLAIIGNASLALDDLPATSPVRPYLEQIDQSSRHATELCKQMLAYSGKGRFVVRPIDLNAVVEDMSQMLQVSISKKAALHLDLAPELPTFDGDTSQITQVIMNLITNASDAIGDRSGVISLCTGVMACDREYLAETFLDDRLEPGTYVFLEVADTGCGMDSETRARMFEPFYSTKFTGRGLGLAAVLGIVRGHRGALKVYSEPGTGTTIKLLLPVSAAASAATERRVESAMKGKWRGSGTVLLIDDEENVRTVAGQTLQRAGFEMLKAADGREALALFREHCDAIVCVLLDLTMPHLDGEQTFRELRKIREDVPVMMSSGYSEDSLASRFAGKGLAGFIQKPYRPDELIAKVREILEG